MRSLTASYLAITSFLIASSSLLSSCASQTLSIRDSSSQRVEAEAPALEVIGSPLVTIPAVADENRVKLAFSAKVKLQMTDERSDKLALGTSAARLSSEPLFGVSSAVGKTLRSLGFKVADDSPLTFSGKIRRFELLSAKNPDYTQAYVRTSFTVLDTFQTPLLEREYEGSSTSNGSAEQKLGAALSDILSQISIDKELQTVLASY